MRTVSETHSPALFMLLYNITLEMMLPYSKAASTTAKQE